MQRFELLDMGHAGVQTVGHGPCRGPNCWTWTMQRFELLDMGHAEVRTAGHGPGRTRLMLTCVLGRYAVSTVLVPKLFGGR